ncbi:MAG TPA: AbrB/MazE/SpoVT family DNA-binding domain-containing protein [Symbiobacteriaceae bacterium]|nr:AbrB/MazE/SpoVT family DNA-binding domain-containing protein [Symbiobacteriaceae bacterium]
MDDLGQVVLPKELRQTLGLSEGDPIEIITQGQTVLLRRYEPLCVFCSNGGPMVLHHGRQVCQICRVHLAVSSPTP